MAEEKGGLWSAFTSGAAKALGGLVVTGAVVWIWEPLRSWLWSALLGIWCHLRQSYALPIWTLYLLAMWSIVMTSLWAIKLMQARAPIEARPTEASFFGALWRWTYDMSGRPINPTPFCRACDMRMVYTQTGRSNPYLDDRLVVRFFCEECKTGTNEFEGDVHDAEGRVLRQIDRWLRTGA